MAKKHLIKRITTHLKNTDLSFPADNLPELLKGLIGVTERAIAPKKQTKRSVQKHYQKHYNKLLNYSPNLNVKLINKYLKQIANGEWKYQINETQTGIYPTPSCKVKYQRKFREG